MRLHHDHLPPNTWHNGCHVAAAPRSSTVALNKNIPLLALHALRSSVTLEAPGLTVALLKKEPSLSWNHDHSVYNNYLIVNRSMLNLANNPISPIWVPSNSFLVIAWEFYLCLPLNLFFYNSTSYLKGTTGHKHNRKEIN